jgi:hypothetical protein
MKVNKGIVLDKKRKDKQGKVKPNVLLPEGIDLSKWLEELKELDATRKNIDTKDNRDLLQKQGLSGDLINIFLEKEEVNLSDISKKDKKALQKLYKDLFGEEAELPDKIGLDDLKRIIKELSSKEEDKKDKLTFEAALETVKKDSKPKDIKQALKDKYRKALEKVLGKIGFSFDLNKDKLKELMRKLGAKNFNELINKIIRQTEEIKEKEETIKKKEKELKDAEEEQREKLENEVNRLRAEEQFIILKNKTYSKEISVEKKGFIAKALREIKEFVFGGGKERKNKEGIQKRLNKFSTLRDILNTLDNYSITKVDELDLSPHVKTFVKEYIDGEYPIVKEEIVKGKVVSLGYNREKPIKEALKDLGAIINYYSLAIQEIGAEDDKTYIGFKKQEVLVDRRLEILKENWEKNFTEILPWERIKLDLEKKILQDKISKLKRDKRELSDKGFMKEEKARENIKGKEEQLDKQLEEISTYIDKNLYLLIPAKGPVR